jgi:hypothetical protein
MYEVEIIERCMGEAIRRRYLVRSPLRQYEALNQSDAEYLCWALNHMTEAQHMDALKREKKDAA